VCHLPRAEEALNVSRRHQALSLGVHHHLEPGVLVAEEGVGERGHDIAVVNCDIAKVTPSQLDGGHPETARYQNELNWMLRNHSPTRNWVGTTRVESLPNCRFPTPCEKIPQFGYDLYVIIRINRGNCIPMILSIPAGFRPEARRRCTRHTAPPRQTSAGRSAVATASRISGRGARPRYLPRATHAIKLAIGTRFAYL
jgi:hypothetical protein